MFNRLRNLAHDPVSVLCVYFFPSASAISSQPHLLANPGRSATPVVAGSAPVAVDGSAPVAVAVGLRPKDLSQLSSLNSYIEPSLWLGSMLLMEP